MTLRSTERHCNAFGVCGACQLLDIPYDEQLTVKQEKIRELFPQAAATGLIRPIMGMEDPFHYRNKVISPYAPAKRRRGKASSSDRKVLSGMYAPGTHRIVSTDDCLLENRTAKRALLAIRQLMEKWNIAPYDEERGEGFIRHGIARAGRSGELLVTIVTNGEEFPSSRSFCRQLVKRVPEVTTVVQNVNMRQTNVILGEREHVLYGPGFILDDLCGLRFRISSASFYQVNAIQAERLYEAAVGLADAGPADTLIDAYCGTGTIGLVAAKRGAGRVIGVEAVAEAVADARQNAKHNGITSAEFVCADATTFMDQGGCSVSGQQLVCLMDPPRAGSTPQCLHAMARLHPKRIVYVSCNPTTQARDVALLEEEGYRISAMQPVDMFPHTHHIENIVAMEPGERMF